MSVDEVYHIPALLSPTVDLLDVHPDGTYVDVTYGGGGHSRAILERLDSARGGHLFAIDQDIQALERAPQDPRLTTVLTNFRFLTNFMRFHGVDGVDGILADLGVSFHHFDDARRGFTFRDTDAPLDMRMNRAARLTAADILNTYDVDAMAAIFKTYGELSNARPLARAIERARAQKPLATTGDLVDAAGACLNAARLKKDLAKLFQALRIVVNDEMGALKKLLADSLTLLKPGGRLVIITYHSLEDRLVKNFMRTGNIDGIQDKDFFGRVNTPFKILTPKPIVPDEAEINANPRSRSAKLRAAEKIHSANDIAQR